MKTSEQISEELKQYTQHPPGSEFIDIIRLAEQLFRKVLSGDAAYHASLFDREILSGRTGVLYESATFIPYLCAIFLINCYGTRRF